MIFGTNKTVKIVRLWNLNPITNLDPLEFEDERVPKPAKLNFIIRNCTILPYGKIKIREKDTVCQVVFDKPRDGYYGFIIPTEALEEI